MFSAECCYVNTAHPDFITGHKAMAIVSEKMYPKPAQPMTDSRGRPINSSTANIPQNQLNTISPEGGKDEGGFFSSFWGQKKKPKPGVLEPVPAVLKATGNPATEREILETEVISKHI